MKDFIQLWNDTSIGYFSPKCGHGVELCLASKKLDEAMPSSLEGKSYLFADTAIEFNKVKACKMTEVRNRPKFRSR